MIPRAHIIEWQKNAPWKTNAQVEQDLVICRSLVELFSDEYLASNLAFRGGTALHKLYLNPQPRYSEDIDLVQINPGPIKEIIQRIQKNLSFIDKKSVVDPRKHNNTLRFRFGSEIPPVVPLKIKIEINCREHFNILGLQKVPFNINSPWFAGYCNITTYKAEELLGTKLRTLYQRSKGRDLFDLGKALLLLPNLDTQALLECYRGYMTFVVDKLPTQKQFTQNLETKIANPEFIGDTTALLRMGEQFDPALVHQLILTKLIEKL